MFTPSSGLNAGDRQSCNLQIYGSDDWVCGFIFDATDEDNCHRIKLTKSGTSLTASLEQVIGGSPTELDAWDISCTISGTDDHWQTSFREYANYVVLGGIFGSPSGSNFNPSCAFPRDASYSKINGAKLGFFVDSFSGSSLTMVRYSIGSPASDGVYGRNTCFALLPFYCYADDTTFSGTNIAKFGGTDEIYYEVDFSDFALTADNCAPADNEAFWTTGNADWSNLDLGGADTCSYLASTESCSTSKWSKGAALLWTANRPFSGNELQQEVVEVEFTLGLTRQFGTGSRSYVFRDYIKWNAFETGFTLAHHSTSSSGSFEPFTGTPVSVAISCV